MADFGIVPAGFNMKTRDDIVAAFEAQETANISAAMDLQATALIGAFNGIIGQEIADGWEVLAALYDGMDPDTASDAQLTSLARMTGTERDPAIPTVVAAMVNVGAGFSAAAGTMFAAIVGNPIAQFTNNDDVSNPSGGAVDLPVTFKAVNAGATQCLAGTLTVIAVPLSGWNSITNATDGTIGSAIESDPSLRIKRAQELATPGTTPVDAIRADLLEGLQPPTTTTATVNVTVLENPSDNVDANGLPPHSVETIVYQPGFTSADNQALADLLWKAKGAGIATYGLDSKPVTDDDGNVHQVFYSRPNALPLYIAITVQVTKDFPLNGALLVSAVLLAYAQLQYGPGNSVIVDALKSSVYPSPVDPAAGVPGVYKVTQFKVDTINPPVNTGDVTIGPRQVAAFDSGRIFVTVVAL